MTLRAIPFLVGLRMMVKLDVSPQMMMTLYAIRSYPGQSYSDIAAHLGEVTQHTYKSARRLVERGLVEDRRVIVHEKTPGVLHVTPAGAEFLMRAMEGNDAGDENNRR